MGNTITTTLDFGFIFEARPPVDVANLSVYRITVHLKSEPFIFGLRADNLCNLHYISGAEFPAERADAKICCIDWTPDSHMRDFEVLDPHSPNELRIARGQGIGVIVMTALTEKMAYLKVYYDCLATKTGGVGIAQCSFMQDNKHDRDIIGHDLGLGYELLVIGTEGKHLILCEPRDERDEKETRIFVESCEGLQRYDHAQHWRRLRAVPTASECADDEE